MNLIVQTKMAGNFYYDFILPLIISLSILTLSIFFYHLLRRHFAVKSTRSYPLIGFLQNRHRFHDWLTDTLSKTPSLTLQLTSIPGCPRRVYTAAPTNLKHILASNYYNYIKGEYYTSVMHELLGTGIITSENTVWAAQSRVAKYIINTQSMQTFAFNTLQLHVSKNLIPHLSSAKDVIDLQQVLRRFSFDYMYNVAIGTEPLSSMYKLFVRAFDAAVEHASERFMCPVPVVWKLKRYFNVGNERTYKEAIGTLNRYVMEVIKTKERRKSYENGLDLMSRFMQSGYDLGFDDENRWKYLRDNIINFILAGTDPISTALTWFFWLLDGHPHCKHMIHKELSMLTSSSRHIQQLNLTFDELNKLHYLHAALSESMRLFPPVPMNSRTAVHDDILPDGTYIQQGWLVNYSAYAMGRMEKLWGLNYDVFKPERWLDDNGVFQASSSFKYPVFNCGDRMCIWKDMALLQMKSVVVGVMHEFEIEVVGGGATPKKMADPPYRLSIFLSKKDGLPVRLKKRQQQSVAPRAKDRRGILVSLFGLFLMGLSFYKHKMYKGNFVTS